MSGKASLLRRLRRAARRLEKAFKYGVYSVKRRDGTWHGVMRLTFNRVGPEARACNQLMKRIDPWFRKDFLSYDVQCREAELFREANRLGR